MKFKDFKVNMSSEIKCMLVEKEERTAKNNSKYMVLTFTDGESTINANLWNHSLESFSFDTGTVFDVHMEAKSYNGGISYQVKNYVATKESPRPYIASAPISPEKMYDDIIKKCDDIGPFRNLTRRILEDHKEKLLYWSAAKSIHHNISGGLLYHIYRMLQIGDKIVSIYKELDSELLFAGIILHDIGKLYELNCSTAGVADYSIDGNLLGHLYIGAELISKYHDEASLSEKEVRLLKHMIVSHHGTREFGAIALPAIPEASVLNYIDCMDAEIYQYEEVRKNMKENTLSDRIFGLRNVHVYKP